MFLINKLSSKSDKDKCKNTPFENVKLNMTTTQKPTTQKTTTQKTTTQKPTTQNPRFSISVMPNDPINFSNWLRTDIKNSNNRPQAWSGNFPNYNELSGKIYKSCPRNQKLCQNKCVPHNHKCHVPTIDQINCQESCDHKWCQDQQKCIPNEKECDIGGKTDSKGCYISAGYSWCEAQQKCTRSADCKPNNLGGDKDSHDCIPSAGYSWCPSKNKCVRLWEEKCP